MSDQISEKMARKILAICGYYIAEFEKQEKFIIDRLRGNGLIKPSKLDEAREFCRNARAAYSNTVYLEGVESAESRFEDAITEILEERE